MTGGISKWWKVDFHVHTPASYDYGHGSKNPERDKNTTPEDFIRQAIDKKLDCMVVCDHNSFGWIEKLRDAMKKMKEKDPSLQEIVIFPGTEINTDGNIHLLAVFDIDVEIKKLERIFGQFGYDEEIQATTKSMSDVMNIIIKNNGIAIPAHVDKESGLIFNNSAATIKNVLNKVEELLAFEVIGENFENELYKESKKKLSYVSGSDSHSLETLGSRITWVKMGAPSLDALRLALYDNEDGIIRGDFYEGNPNDLNNRIFLKSIEVDQAKYAGRRKPLKVEFSPWMTSLIGGRGTGKSSVVQFLRLALDKGDELPYNLKKEFDDFVNIPKNRTELGMLTDQTTINLCIVKNGIEYAILWKNSNIYELTSESEEIAVGISDRFPVRIFNQKQLFEMTKDPQLLLKYIDLRWDSIGWKKKIDSVKNAYINCAIAISENNARLDEKRRKEVSLREIENKIQLFETDETKKVLENQKEILIAEQQAKSAFKVYENIINKAKLLKEAIDNVGDIDPLNQLDDANRKVVEKWMTVMDCFVKRYLTLYSETPELEESIGEWFGKLSISEDKSMNREELKKVIERLKEQGVDDIELYPNLLQQKDLLLRDLEVYADASQRGVELEEERKSILQQFYSLIEQRIEERSAVIREWNGSGNLKIALLPMGNLEKNEEQFRSIIGKAGTTFSSDILDRNKDDEYDKGIIFELAKCAQTGYSQKLKNICDSLSNPQNGDYSKKFVTHMLAKIQEDNSILNELYMWVPEDHVRLELNIGKGKSRFIAIDAGSAGQRTSAILTLLLQISDEPIIIDQPEDDLDTKNITDFIVKGINNKKKNQQIIVVTHNPNIVVNTNSEQVVHMEYAGGEINATHSGALQNYEIRDAICEVMEGGRDALESRYYRITKALNH